MHTRHTYRWPLFPQSREQQNPLYKTQASRAFFSIQIISINCPQQLQNNFVSTSQELILQNSTCLSPQAISARLFLPSSSHLWVCSLSVVVELTCLSTSSSQFLVTFLESFMPCTSF